MTIEQIRESQALRVRNAHGRGDMNEIQMVENIGLLLAEIDRQWKEAQEYRDQIFYHKKGREDQAKEAEKLVAEIDRLRKPLVHNDPVWMKAQNGTWHAGFFGHYVAVDTEGRGWTSNSVAPRDPARNGEDKPT